MKKIFSIVLSAILLSLASPESKAQTASDLAVSQEGNFIVVKYTLDKPARNVQLLVSKDGGKSFSSPLKEVVGDVGDVAPGRRKIVWSVLEEYGSFVGDDIMFEVVCLKGKKKTLDVPKKDKKSKFESEIGLTGLIHYKHYHPYNDYYNAGGPGFSFPLNFGWLIKDKHYCGLIIEPYFVNYEYNPGYDWGHCSGMQFHVVLGLDYRCFANQKGGVPSKMWFGARLGVPSILESPNFFIVQAQIGYMPCKWLNIIAFLGYPSVNLGVSFNIPNMFRK